MKESKRKENFESNQLRHFPFRPSPSLVQLDVVGFAREERLALGGPARRQAMRKELTWEDSDQSLRVRALPPVLGNELDGGNKSAFGEAW